MAMGRRCGSNANCANQHLGLGFVRNTRSMSGKRVALLSNTEATKKHCIEKMIHNHEQSMIESLSLDILIRILCGVDHDDLKKLFHVSKTFREATLVAKKWHFAYSTPLKTSVFRSSIDLRDVGNSEEVEPPNAPKQRQPCSSRLIRKNVCNISVALFTSPDE
ncbi:hypothetical protein RHMOL_Rhmol02G0129300 [Rhododendron molle]|uniref:Uncharacterized protein n=1 Tax=Rhododendron molle TaxID=49168 RepID=A0ACC0PPK3_RHOML|nr:hypothetical protein RHMOL_Rhmol02G0129300 [Rhododendron molle]